MKQRTSGEPIDSVELEYFLIQVGRKEKEGKNNHPHKDCSKDN